MSFIHLMQIKYRKDLKILGYFFFLFFIIISFFFGLILIANYLYMTQSEQTISNLSKNSPDVTVRGNVVGNIRDFNNYNNIFNQWSLLTEKWFNQQFPISKISQAFSSNYFSYSLPESQTNNQILDTNRSIFTIQLFNKTQTTYILGIDQYSFQSFVNHTQAKFLLLSSDFNLNTSQIETNITTSIQFSWMFSQNRYKSINYYNLTNGEISTNSSLLGLVSTVVNSRYLYNVSNTFLLLPISQYSNFIARTNTSIFQIFASQTSFTTQLNFVSRFNGTTFWENFPSSLQLLDNNFIYGYSYGLNLLYENNLSDFTISQSSHYSSQLNQLLMFDETFKELIIPLLFSISIIILFILLFHVFYIFDLIREDPVNSYLVWFLITRGVSRVKLALIFITALCITGFFAITSSLLLFVLFAFIFNFYSLTSVVQLIILSTLILGVMLIVELYEYWNYLNTIIQDTPAILSPQLYETARTLNYQQNYFSKLKSRGRNVRLFALITFLSIVSSTIVYTYLLVPTNLSFLTLTSFFTQIYSLQSLEFMIIILVILLMFLGITILFYVLLRVFLGFVNLSSRYIRRMGYIAYRMRTQFNKQLVSLVLICAVVFLIVFSFNLFASGTNYDSFQFIHQNGTKNVIYLSKSISTNDSLTISQLSNELDNVLHPLQEKQISFAYQVVLRLDIVNLNLSAINGKNAPFLMIAIPSPNYFDVINDPSSYQIQNYAGKDVFSNVSSFSSLDNLLLIQKDQYHLLNLSSGLIPNSWFNVNTSAISRIKTNGTFMYWPELTDFSYMDSDLGYFDINAVMGWHIAQNLFKNMTIANILTPSSPSDVSPSPITLYVFSNQNQVVTSLSNINPLLSANGWVWNPQSDYFTLNGFISLDTLISQVLPIWNYFAVVFVFFTLLVNILFNTEVVPIYDRRIYRVETVLGVQRKNILFYTAIQAIILDILGMLLGIVVGLLALYLFLDLQFTSGSLPPITRYFNSYYSIFSVNIGFQPTLLFIIIFFFIDILLRIKTLNNVLNTLKLTRPVWDD